MGFQRGGEPWNKGKPLSKEHKAKISKSRQGNNPWNKGLITGIVTLGAFEKGHTPYNKGFTKEELAARGQGYGGWQEGTTHSDKTRNKIGNSNRGHKQSAEANYKRRLKLQGHPPSVEARKSSSEWLLHHWQDPHWRNAVIRKISKTQHQKWQDPQFRTEQIEIIIRSQHRRPNRPERCLQEILGRHYPGEWGYTGDGSHAIGGFSVDFTNINGQKAVIELFGNYWHNRLGMKWHQSELGRIMACNSLGFKCLVIWEHELEDEAIVVDKVKQFMMSKK